MTNNSEDKPRVRPPSVQAAYLLEKVRKMESEEAGVVEAERVAHRQWVQEKAAEEDRVAEVVRIKHRARIAGLIAKAPADVQELYFALARAGKGEE